MILHDLTHWTDPKIAGQVLLLMIHIFPSLTYAECARGFTGPDCLYICNCVNENCLDSGECITGKECEPPYYGLACQYDDLLQLDLIVNGNNSCGADLIKIDESTVEGYCPNSSQASDVNLVPSSPRLRLCDVYISGGRQVVKRFKSTMLSFAVWANDSLLVDNNHDTCISAERIRNGHCIFSFDNPYQIVSLRFYSNAMKVHWREIIIYGEESASEKLFSYELKSYDITDEMFNMSKPVIIDTLYLNFNGMQRQTSISLCELQVFGDCTPGKYGLDCKEDCNNECPLKLCHGADGYCYGCAKSRFGKLCENDCAPGTWGLNCNKVCETKCTGRLCNKDTGTCSNGCAGYSDFPTCTIACLPGTWGTDCSEDCLSANCDQNSCDKHTGLCNIGCGGFVDFPNCKQVLPGKDIICKQGFIGKKCKQQCHCQDMMCDSKGGCVNGKRCVKPWFYHGCQYYDVALSSASENQKLTDHDDTTCFNPDNQFVTLKLSEPSVFTWIRVVFENEVSNLSLYLRKLDATVLSTCEYQRILEKSKNTFEIYCLNTLVIDSVSLSWYGPGSICSLYINGGRSFGPIIKVTLPKQFLIDTKLRKLFSSLTNETYPKDECLNLSNSSSNNLSITLQDPKLTTKIVLRGITSTELINDEISIPPTTYSRINELQLEVTSGSFNLCQIQMFGECPLPYFGLQCDEICILTCHRDMCNFDGSCYQCGGHRTGDFCLEFLPVTDLVLNNGGSTFVNEHESGTKDATTFSGSFVKSFLLLLGFVVVFVGLKCLFRDDPKDSRRLSTEITQLEVVASLTENIAESLEYQSEVQDEINPPEDDDEDESVASVISETEYS